MTKRKLDEYKAEGRKILDAKTREELADVITPLLDPVQPSPSPEHDKEFNQLRYMARQTAIRIHRENPTLPTIPTNPDLSATLDWCITLAPIVEYSKPLSTGKWADVFGVCENTIRKWRKEGTYHFKQKSSRRWVLPMNELPAEYLVKYHNHIS
jgi:hypothetical protein